jgi:hypothetical protein
MLYSLKRNLQCRQVGQIQLNISISSAGVASGPDAAFVESVTHTALSGLYVINFKEPAKIAPLVSGLVMLSTGVVGYNPASTVSSISIQIKTDAGVAADAAFNVQAQFMDQLSYYF